MYLLKKQLLSEINKKTKQNKTKNNNKQTRKKQRNILSNSSNIDYNNYGIDSKTLRNGLKMYQQIRQPYWSAIIKKYFNNKTLRVEISFVFYKMIQSFFIKF